MSNAISVCEEKVFNEIYKSQAEPLRNHLYYKCGNIELAEDLVQDSFHKLWEKCKEIIYNSVVGFLYSISNNLFIDKKRSEKVSLKFEKTIIEKKETDDPFFLLRTKEFNNKLEKTISQLPEGQREAFLMNRIDKLSYSEIAKRLGVSQTAVEKRISKALIKVRDQIEEFKNLGL